MKKNKQIIFDKKNVLVAGGAGFIGSHLCDRLVENSKVICVDNFVTGKQLNIDHLLANPNFIFINHDLAEPLDFSQWPELSKFKINFQGIQEIYNLACPMSVNNFLENRFEVLKSSTHVVKNLLDLAVEQGAKFMQFSSSVVYGPRSPEDRGHKVVENEWGAFNHLSERSIYDEGKRFAETIVNSYRQIFNLDTKIVRLFRVYGPRMNFRDGQMIPDFIMNALEGKDITIYGDESFSSSFCYVDDSLDGVMKLMESEHSGPINIGSDLDVPIVDVVKMIINLTNSKAKINYVDNLLFFSELILPNTQLARTALDWMPIVTLENGLKKTIFDIQAHKKLQSFGA